MTPVGHSLVGISVGVVYCTHQEKTSYLRLSIILGMVLCANIPDIPLPGWGHSSYEFSHSILVGGLLALSFAFVTRILPASVGLVREWQFIASSSLALFSHYLLDSLYNHGQGVAIYWPISKHRLALPVPWLETMKLEPLLSWDNARIWGAEFVTFGVILLLILAAMGIYKGAR